ncbi:MAG: hypothetical protein U5Q03_11810 [Bacteroidota bacterium]|nr:hypothetical protein [Bacteroidota bacterium]
MADILKWQKRLDDGSWHDISCTLSIHMRKIPPAQVTWDYRAIVQEGTCPEAYSDAAEVIVLDPGTVWTGNIDSELVHIRKLDH